MHAAQLGKRFKRGAEVEDAPEYARASHLLASLGLQKYQANLKRGMLNDATVLLWTDRCCSCMAVPGRVLHAPLPAP